MPFLISSDYFHAYFFEVIEHLISLFFENTPSNERIQFWSYLTKKQ